MHKVIAKACGEQDIILRIRKKSLPSNILITGMTLNLPERFRGEVVMPHDENNEHACTGCTACELACPNGTIKIITKFDITPEGKKKKALDTFVYHLELCTMCNLCIVACPTDAIKMAQTFEHSVFDRSKLTKY